MNLEEVRSFVIRHRVTIQDLGILFATLAVAAFVTFEVDVFLTEGSVSLKQETIELDEVLLLGALLAVGLLIFTIRRYYAQKRETQRRIVAEQRVRELAFQDGLTGLANRRQFDDALQAAIGAPPRAGAAHALFLLDLNGFKQINDVFGHNAGDDVLVVVAQRLLGAAREGDLVARFGGDEFAILAQHLVGPEAATNIALRIIQALEDEIVIGNTRHRVGAGIGIALVPHDATVAAEAIRKADVALYRAKAERRSALRFFEEGMDAMVRERERMERELRAALATDSIQVLYVPSVDLKTREIVGFEAVPRWNHPELGEIPAERFIPIAEETGLIHLLAAGMLRKACATASKWPARVTLSIDVFAGQLNDPELSSRVMQIVAETGLAPSRLEIEIAESVLVRDLTAAQSTFGALRGHGVKIALDNFGTGYSSLYHLRNFKLDKIKIDRTFVGDLAGTAEESGIVQALIGLGQGLGVTVSAEGIEDPAQRAKLVGSGVEQGQGHLFSEPLPAAATARLFAIMPL